MPEYNPDQIPYMLHTYRVYVTEAQGPVTIWVCANLLDHRVLGVATNRNDALAAMRENTLNQRWSDAADTPKCPTFKLEKGE